MKRWTGSSNFTTTRATKSDTSVWSALRSLGPAGSGSDETGLAFSIPTDAGTPGQYILVFRGRLGNEPGAVIGKSVFLGEAFCVVMQGVWDQRWTFVWDMLRNRPADIRDGRGQPLAYPVREDNTTLRSVAGAAHGSLLREAARLSDRQWRIYGS